MSAEKDYMKFIFFFFLNIHFVFIYVQIFINTTHSKNIHLLVS